MANINIRLDESTKTLFQEIAKFKGETISSLALKAINEMIEDELDRQAIEKIVKMRTADRKIYSIEKLFDEYDIEY